MNTTLPSVVTVPFHGANLFVVDHAGEPYVPMRPIVEGMGMNWAGQHEKLAGSRFGGTVREIQTVAEDGKQRQMICLPLRKLPGWLMSIYPNKVRAELRERIVQYQNECDDVLWQYWNAGRVENPRAATKPAAGTAPALLTADQQTTIKELVHSRVEALPQDKRAGAAIKCWSALKSKFGCTYKRIPSAQFTEALSLVARLPLEGELLGRETQVMAPRDASADMTAALEQLLAEAHSGITIGLAAVAFRRDGGYVTLVSHATAWNPLIALGGVDRLHRYMHQLADTRL